ncbi:RNA-binding protein Musashi like protein 2 [Myotis davidii]|uniref:RNA-binding protein Musashi like protein 2 n=1 Tax=Myotis davidii TaxID=225400 RepID=L5M6V7_MYODS|nr:RNA-binding protein Musashi like protein 2 [Myotis davidii]
MVTRTKKIFVGGLSANTVVEDVKQYFEQFGKVGSASECPDALDQSLEVAAVAPAFATAVSFKSRALELGHQDGSEIRQELRWKSPACGWHSAHVPAGADRVAFERGGAGICWPLGAGAGSWRWQKLGGIRA